MCQALHQMQICNFERDVDLSPYSSQLPCPFAFHPNLPLSLCIPNSLTELSTSLRSPKHSPYLFYSFSRSSSTLKPTVVSLLPPPLHWVIEWSSNYKMQWMFSRHCLTWSPNHFDTSYATLGKSFNFSESQFSHQWKRDNSIFLIELLRDSIK